MLKKLYNSIGIINLIFSIYYIVKKINQATETKIVSDEALDALQKKENVDKLDQIVSEFHRTGQWDREGLRSIR